MRLLTCLTAVAAAVLLLAACGTGRVPEKRDTFIAEYTWTLDDYAKKADGLWTRSERMQSPFRDDAQYKIYLLNEKILEARTKLEELKKATGDRERDLTAELTAIMEEVKTLYDKAAEATGP